MTALTALEAEARALIDGDRAAADFSPFEQMVRACFKAMYASALPIDQVVRVSCALTNMSETEETTAGVKKAATALVRRKVLRTRRAQGRTLYELALS